MSEKDWSKESRLTWTDENWANYLGCPVSKVQEYKKILDQNFVMAIERDRNTKNYFMNVYRYDIAPSGFKRLQLLLSSNRQFADIKDALHDANGIISKMELNKMQAKWLNMPQKAIQMMLIREN